MTSRRLILLSGLAALIGTAGHQARAADKVSQDLPSPDACTKTINAMGASMGHTAETTADGRPIYRFVLRQNGFDYDVTCDPASGVVGDVTPRTTH